MSETKNYYTDLRFDYDLLIELPQLKDHPRTCLSTLFFNRSRYPGSKTPLELAQIDAFWLMHLFRWGHLEISSAKRLIEGAFITLIEDYDSRVGTHVKIDEGGWQTIWGSLRDDRMSTEVFPFIEDVEFATQDHGLPYEGYVTREYIKQRGDLI